MAKSVDIDSLLSPEDAAFARTQGWDRPDKIRYLTNYISEKLVASKKSGGVTDRANRYRAQKHLKDACEVCGSTKNLQAHHIDGNERNYNKGNIQTVCETCHKSWTRYQAGQGKGKGGRIPKGWKLPGASV